MKSYILLGLFILGSVSIKAQDLNVFFTKADTFFKANVADGKVAYETIYKNQAALTELLEIAKGSVVNKQEASKYQAFWINAYNLSVIKGIIDNYPTNSPLDIAGFFDETTYALGGKDITLNDIEHKLLRGQFNDARFHFVLVCGALGCPPLINSAYVPDTLDNQLETQTKLAINGDFLRVNEKKKRVEASQIMEWYKEDFTMNGETEIDFINRYRTDKVPSNFKIKYFPYNWKVNKQ
ncbi:DUF547 domain-containing protein [Cognatitamlana onchidii]|uniref:DUF547 domain-containing protein n=1 Tax=Cognatitamlana onchidii TaxID=2562860 RepID=UPI0010A6294D|nr:DUF547 domain-containing protein [Algibacter onchidii]